MAMRDVERNWEEQKNGGLGNGVGLLHVMEVPVLEKPRGFSGDPERFMLLLRCLGKGPLLNLEHSFDRELGKTAGG